MGWRGGETGALHMAEGKKKRKSTYCPVSFHFFFIDAMENHHGDVTGEHAQAQPQEVWVCVWGFLLASG